MIRLRYGLSALALTLVAALVGCGSRTTAQSPAYFPALPGSWVGEPAPLPHIFAANGGGGTVTEYKINANGNVASVRTIGGNDTGLSHPTGIAVDASGKIYVGNLDADVNVFSRSANGDAKPIATLHPVAPNPTLFAQGIALDASDNLYIANGSLGEILVYPPGAHGNVAPARNIHGPNVRCTVPTGIDVDHAGHIWVTSGAMLCEFAVNADGDATPIAIIVGQHTKLQNAGDVKVNSSGQIFVAVTWPGGDILRFKPGANGDVVPTHAIVPAPVITNPFPVSLALFGNDVFSALGNQRSTLDVAIVVYPQSANGHPAPLRSIVGSSTGLNETMYIAVH